MRSRRESENLWSALFTLAFFLWAAQKLWPWYGPALVIVGIIIRGFAQYLKDKRKAAETARARAAYEAWYESTKPQREQAERERAEAWRAREAERRRRLEDLESLRRIGGGAFEVLMAEVLNGMGYQAICVGGAGDGGVDIDATLNGERILIQTKNYKHPVGPGPVRDLYGTMMASGVKRGLLITTSTVTDGARRFAEDKGIEFITKDHIVDLIKKHNEVFFSAGR